MVQALARRLAKRFHAKAEVHQTHISSVILCAHAAYKLKRPVHLALVDFSSLKRRRRDYQKEVEINRRTAPDLYIGVVRITGSVDMPDVDGHGDLLDWAVSMKRFPQSSIALNALKHNRLDTELVVTLSDHLASFHLSLPATKLQPNTAPSDTQVWLEQSLAEITTAQPAYAVTAQTLRDASRAWAQSLMPSMQRRAQDGFRRHCHGDLHLQNLLISGKQIMAFDAIEFDTRLAQIDIVNDIAFTFMDLLAQDRADLAWTLINRWCERTGDYESLRLLRYYTLYRAIVRAKVSLLSSNLSEFDRYWSLSGALTRPANPSKLILVAGVSGSGKSTVARLLVSLLSGIQIRTDVIRKRFAQTHPDKAQPLYSSEAVEQTYDEVRRLCEILLASNLTVIVDATFTNQHQIDQFAGLARRTQARLAILNCQAPQAVLRRRISKRQAKGRDASDATVAVMQSQLLHLESHPNTWPIRPVNIDTNVSSSVLRSRLCAIASAL